MKGKVKLNSVLIIIVFAWEYKRIVRLIDDQIVKRLLNIKKEKQIRGGYGFDLKGEYAKSRAGNFAGLWLSWPTIGMGFSQCICRTFFSPPSKGGELLAAEMH